MNVFVSSVGSLGSGFVTDVVVLGVKVATVDEFDIAPVEFISKIVVVAPTNGPWGAPDTKTVVADSVTIVVDPAIAVSIGDWVVAVPVLDPSEVFENVVNVLNGGEGLDVVSVHVESVEKPTLDDGEGVPDVIAKPVVVVAAPVAVDDCFGLVDDEIDLFE